jgi:PIN domain nuclease of toxin-antitoxin system
LALLLDTNVILFALMVPSHIPVHVKRMIEAPNTACVTSVVSLYKIGIKFALGKLAIPETFDFLRHMQRSDGIILDIKPRHAIRAAKLPLNHRDPWDCLIVAQCFVDGHQLVSVDMGMSALGYGGFGDYVGGRFRVCRAQPSDLKRPSQWQQCALGS